jgi:hypothetical protein
LGFLLTFWHAAEALAALKAAKLAALVFAAEAVALVLAAEAAAALKVDNANGGTAMAAQPLSAAHLS